MISRSIYFLVLISFLYACESKREEEVCSVNFKSQPYQNNELQLKISLPAKYKIINDDPTFYVMAYLDDNKLGKDYIESLGINFFVNEENQNLMDIYNSAMEQDLKQYNLSQDISDFKIEENESLYINGIDIKSAKISYHQKGQIPLTLFDYYCLSKGHAYKFTFACNQSDADSLECKFVEIMKSLNSI